MFRELPLSPNFLMVLTMRFRHEWLGAAAGGSAGALTAGSGDLANPNECIA
jgi:hypothetical protein